MICYRCGCTLSEKDYCTGCGADVSMYKKILAISNRYYNEGLEKCQVRDLSGAITSLRQSIKLNKNNVDARNLLGLVYYEIGEITEALGQWVISNNIRDTKNIATDYIRLIQENPANLEAMNQNIRKFNQSLTLCYNDSLDYAVIQLKKILSVAPKYLKAHQLLALIYIRIEEWDKAKKEIDRCEQIDANNTTTMRYKQEIETVLTPVDSGKSAPKRPKKDNSGVAVYKSGNDTIIQPVNKYQGGAGSILLNIGIGLLIGVAITYFLVLPSKIYAVNESANNKIATISDEKDKKSAELDELQLKYDQLSSENDSLKNSPSSSVAVNSSASDGLLMAINSYFENPEDMASIAEALEVVEAAEIENPGARSTAFISMYEYLMDKVGVNLSSYYYSIGYDNYNNEEYIAAIPNLNRAYKYNENNGDALFYLATAYRRSGDEVKAKELYAEVMDKYPGTERASRAQTYLAEMNSQG